MSNHDTCNQINIREARPEDDAQICALLRRVSMPGNISATTDYEPSYFSAIEIHGYEHRVAVAEADNQIIGIRIISKKRVFLNGNPVDFGYVSRLYADPVFKGRKIALKLVHYMAKWHQEGFEFPHYLFAVLQDNMIARNIFTSGLPGVPPIEYVGTLYSAAIPLFKRRHLSLPGSIKIVRGSMVGAVKIAEFLNRTGRKKQFFPVYTANDIMSETGILRGLYLDDFYIALKGNQIVGLTACWNQMAFARVIITGYPWYLQVLNRLSSPFLSHIFKMAPLPKPEETAKNVCAACIAVEDNNQQIFESLLNTILNDQYNTGKTCLVVGLMESDPLSPVLHKHWHLPSRTCIYMASWKGFDILSNPNEQIPYIEAASL